MAAEPPPDKAQSMGVTNRHAGRLARLAYLAPDITESILDGTQPPHLSLRRLMVPIPLSWSEQRRKFGFPVV